jgi:3-hydroxyacyl-CoA dehydrogenase
MAEEPVRSVAVLGAGVIGASWVAMFAARGIQVRVWDPQCGAAQIQAVIDGAAPALAAMGHPVDNALWTIVSSPIEAVHGADFVQENAPENLAMKRALFQQVTPVLGPRTVISSSTSGLMASAMQEGLDCADRILVGHPFNPPHMVPLVEVVGGRDTAPWAVERAVEFYRAVGKHPLKIDREVPGHVVDRLQAALFREMIHMIREGIATPEMIDQGMIYGPGLRWSVIGPCMQMHLSGGEAGVRHLLNHLGPAIESWWGHLGQPTIDDRAKDLMEEGMRREAGGRSVAELCAERDKALLGVLKALEENPRPGEV